MNMSPIILFMSLSENILWFIETYWNILKLCHLVRSSCLQSHRGAGYVLRPGDVLKLLLFASAGGTSSMLSRCLLWTIYSGTRLYKHTNSICTYLLIFMHIDTVYIYIGQGWIRLNIAQINPLLGHSQEAKAAGKGRTSPVGMKKKRVQQVWTTAGQPDIRNCGKTRPITSWLVCCSYSEPHPHDPGLGLIVGVNTAPPREWVIINIWHRYNKHM